MCIRDSPTSSGNTKRQIQMMKDLGTDILACTPSYALLIADTAIEMGYDPAVDFLSLIHISKRRRRKQKRKVSSMGKATVIPFGPQHPVLPEPLHLDLVVEDETVIEAVPQIGFIHRGLEKLVETRDYNQFIYVAERICGICAFGHSMGYAETVEKLMGVEIPERAEYLRVIWHELSRIHSHVLWMGLAADAFGFESLFMHCWRLRERVLDIFEKTTGGRVIFSVVKVGGVAVSYTHLVQPQDQGGSDVLLHLRGP